MDKVHDQQTTIVCERLLIYIEKFEKLKNIKENSWVGYHRNKKSVDECVAMVNNLMISIGVAPNTANSIAPPTTSPLTTTLTPQITMTPTTTTTLTPQITPPTTTIPSFPTTALTITPALRSLNDLSILSQEDHITSDDTIESDAEEYETKYDGRENDSDGTNETSDENSDEESNEDSDEKTTDEVKQTTDEVKQTTDEVKQTTSTASITVEINNIVDAIENKTIGSSTTNHRQATTNHRQATTNHRQATTNIIFVNIGGYYFDQEYIKFRKFRNVVLLAESILDNASLIIYGSFTHYIAWCVYNDYDFKTEETIKKFIQSGNKIPEDLDVLDPTMSVTSRRDYSHVISKKDTIRDEPSNIPNEQKTGASFGLFYNKIAMNVNDDVIGQYNIHVDVIRRHGLCSADLTGPDFDVNSLVLTYDGLWCEKTHMYFNCIDLNIKTKNAYEVFSIINKIIDKKAKFINKFDEGVLQATGRKKLIRRFRKIIDNGFQIEGDWDKKYPIIDITNEYSADEQCCIICYQNQLSTKSHILPCCSTGTTIKILCNNCFWSLLDSCAENGTKYSCAMCKHSHLLY